MKIYLASGNLNKKREFSQILTNYTIVIPSDEGIIFEPEETGSTFHENSMIKALALWNIVHEPVIADDSGICVDALGGIPGVYSSRYAGPEFPRGAGDGKKIPQLEQNRLLIGQLNTILAKGVNTTRFPNGPRSCSYVCSMVLLLKPDRFFISQETMEGILASSIDEAAGTGGFGYDPIFFLPDHSRTAAQLTSEQKNLISHRGKAVKMLTAVLEKLEK
jgi:XTP/dITP diphosphohydrolase